MALKFSRAGISSVIGSVRQINHLLEKSDNCIYFGRLGGTTGRTEYDNQTLNFMSKNNTSLFFLHDEGGFFLENEYEHETHRVYPESIFKLPVLEKVFFWGERQKNVFNNHEKKSKFLLTGSPRFDLARPEYEYLDTELVSELKKKYKDFVLISGRFAPVNMVPDDPNFLGKRMYEIHVESGELNTSSKEGILNVMFKDWEKTSIEFSRFVSSVAKLAIEFPEMNFVFRPHPAERSSFYKEPFSHFDNVFVDKSYDVRPFIRASKAIIHCECTTGIEAEISKKPNINFRPCSNLKEFDGAEVAGVSNVGTIVQSYDELRSCVQELIDTDFKFTESTFDTSRYLLNSKSNDESSEIILNQIIEFCNKSKSKSKIKTFTQFSFGRTFRYAKLILKRVLVFLFFKKHMESGDSKVIFYPKKKIEKLWSDLGGDPKCINVSSDVIYTYPGETVRNDKLDK